MNLPEQAPAPIAAEPVAPLPPAAPTEPSGDRPVRWARMLTFAALAPLGYLLQRICAGNPEQTEAIYSRGIYPYIQSGLAAVAELSPVAIGESLLLASLAWIAWRLFRGALGWWRGRRTARNLLLHVVAQAAATFGVLALLFQLLWGLNHARLPFARQLGLQTEASQPARLARVVHTLAHRAAAVRPPGLVGDQPFLAADWRRRIGEAYDIAGAELPVLQGPRPTIRRAWISRVMTLGSITGIYSPFTGEPNVNAHAIELMQPFVACHEVAHLRGYAREDEADFIAWYVGSRSPDPTIAYSCELIAYRIAMHQLMNADAIAAILLRQQLPREVLGDNLAIDSFWDGQPRAVSHVVTQIARTSNDIYLKSSGHADGVNSYGRMVDLLIAHFER